MRCLYWLTQVRWCRDNFLNVRSLRKAQDIYEQVSQGSADVCCRKAAISNAEWLSHPHWLHWLQLSGHLVNLGIAIKSCGEDTTNLRRALVSGIFPHAAKWQVDGELLS